MTTERWLRVLDGPGKGKIFRLKSGPNIVGSGKTADIPVKGPTVSEEHAVIEVTAKGLIVLRNRSPHGTAVSGRQVNIHELRPGDEILIGGGLRLQYGVGELQAQEQSRQSEGGSESKPARRGLAGRRLSIKQILIAAGLLAYLLGMVALVVSFESNPDSEAPEEMTKAIDTAIEETRKALRAVRAQPDSTDAPPASGLASEFDPSAAYYSLLAAKAAGRSEEDITAAIDKVVVPVQAKLREARILEQQGRLREARRYYREVVDALPDTRLPAARFAVERLTVIRQRLPSDK